MRYVRAIAGLCAVIFLAGCAGYRLGPVNGEKPGARSVTVRPFRNDTFEPRLTETVDFALRRKLQQDGTYRLETQDEGNIIVSGVITELRRSPVSFDPNDVITPRDYDMYIIAIVTAYDRSNSKTIFKREFSGRTTVRATANRDIPERQAEPVIAEDLARNIASALTEGPW